MIKGPLKVVGRAPATAPHHREYLPGQLIMRIRPDAVRPHIGAARLSAATEWEAPPDVAGPLDYLRRNAGLKSVRPIFSKERQRFSRLRLKKTKAGRLSVLTSVADSEHDDLAGINLLEVDPKKLTARLLKRLSDVKTIEFAEAVPARWLAASGPDPFLNLQWGLRAIRWFQAARPNASKVTVAVLDTGIDEDHPDFEGVSITYHHAGLRVDDLIGHGTHVAGIIAAAINNAVGISGVARCRVESWKVFSDMPDAEDGEYYVDYDKYLEALRALRDGPARVVNLSLGGTASSRTEAILFRGLVSRRILPVAAMGNEYGEGNPTEYPAAYPGVLAVGAVGENLKRSSFSNTGKHIGLCAPGSNILSTLPMAASPARSETEYDAWSGTSMATPHVAAAAALLIAKRPSWTVEQLRAKLTSTANKLAAMGGKSRNRAYGSGLLNLQAALA